MQLFLVIISDKLQNNLIIFNFAHGIQSDICMRFMLVNLDSLTNLTKYS